MVQAKKLGWPGYECYRQKSGGSQVVIIKNNNSRLLSLVRLLGLGCLG